MTQLDLLDALHEAQKPKRPGRHPVSCNTRTCADCKELRGNTITIVLQVSVPLWIHEAAQVRPTARARVLDNWRRQAADEVASRGDILQYRGATRGETARVFNVIAKGMAALAVQPGGFRFFGLMWCARHSPGGAIADGLVCRTCASEEGAA